MKASAAILALLTLFFCQARCPAQSVTLPDTLTVEEPGLIVLRAKTFDADGLRWFVVGGKLQTFPPDVVTPKLGTFAGFTLTAGTFKVGCLAAKCVGGKAVMSLPVYCTVTVGSPQPPTPPTPPTPTDPLTQTLQAAFNLDTDADRAKSLQYLQGVYQGMAAQAPSHVELSTNLAWIAWEKSVVEQDPMKNPGGLTANQVKNLRTAIANDTKSAWGANQAPITTVQAQSQLTRISNALQGVK